MEPRPLIPSASKIALLVLALIWIGWNWWSANTVLLGGRAAEMLVFNEPSTGAADDLVKATDLARDMVLRYGMESSLGLAVYGEKTSPFLEPQSPAGRQPAYASSEQTAQRIDDAVKDLLAYGMEHATELLRARRTVLDQCVKALLAKETLEEQDLLVLLAASATPQTTGA